jgi:hypothetical protein
MSRLIFQVPIYRDEKSDKITASKKGRFENRPFCLLILVIFFYMTSGNLCRLSNYSFKYQNPAANCRILVLLVLFL